jgi:hypothetical protein
LTWAAAALPARPIHAEQGLGCHHRLLQGRRQATLKVEAVQLTDTGSQRSSAVIAILLRDPGYERLRDGLTASEQASTGAPSVVESSLVLCARLGRAGKTLLARFLEGRSGGPCVHMRLTLAASPLAQVVSVSTWSSTRPNWSGRAMNPPWSPGKSTTVVPSWSASATAVRLASCPLDVVPPATTTRVDAARSAWMSGR